MIYDCTNEVKKHQMSVIYWLAWVTRRLEYRGEHHDESKLLSPEKDIFDQYTPRLKEYEFGSARYNIALGAMGEGLAHHYRNNRHHPEHYDNGVDGMTLIDLVEMFCDWVAACAEKGTAMDMEYLAERFKLTPQLRSILANTLLMVDTDRQNSNLAETYSPKCDLLSREEIGRMLERV